MALLGLLGGVLGSHGALLEPFWLEGFGLLLFSEIGHRGKMKVSKVLGADEFGPPTPPQHPPSLPHTHTRVNREVWGPQGWGLG